MKKIEVVKNTPPPPQEKITVVTPLTGKEFVGYYTESGHLCVLHRISKDKRSDAQFGFINLGYSDQSSPTFVGRYWFDSLKAAAAQRELFFWNDYTETAKLFSGRAQFDMVCQWASEKRNASPFVYPLDKSSLDLTGSGEVNHTHRNMTLIVEKLNEAIAAHNEGYKRNKERLFAFSYGGDPATIKDTLPRPEPGPEPGTEPTPAFSKIYLAKVLAVAYDHAENESLKVFIRRLSEHLNSSRSNVKILCA